MDSVCRLDASGIWVRSLRVFLPFWPSARPSPWSSCRACRSCHSDRNSCAAQPNARDSSSRSRSNSSCWRWAVGPSSGDRRAPLCRASSSCAPSSSSSSLSPHSPTVSFMAFVSSNNRTSSTTRFARHFFNL